MLQFVILLLDKSAFHIILLIISRVGPAGPSQCYDRATKGGQHHTERGGITDICLIVNSVGRNDHNTPVMPKATAVFQ